MLKFKKVYIDSYYRVSGTSSDFTVDLPETVQLEDNMLCQIHEVSIPHSWYSINGTNNNLYFRHQVIPPAVPNGITYRKITIPEGNYTASDLAQTIEIALNLRVDTETDLTLIQFTITVQPINLPSVLIMLQLSLLF